MNAYIRLINQKTGETKMYRLSSIDDRDTQKIVSKELAAGFRYVFNMKSDGYEISEDDLIGCCVYNETLFPALKNKPFLEHLKVKLTTMIKELNDTENEYTFDTFGEFLLYSVLERGAEMVETQMLEDETEWKSTVFETERTKLCNMLKNEYEDENLFSDEEIKIIVDRMTYFPKMIDEVLHEIEEPSFDVLFWDWDFALYEDMDMGTVNKFISQNGEYFGFVDSEDNEPGSGSLKIPLK